MNLFNAPSLFTQKSTIEEMPFSSTDSFSRFRVASPGFRFDSQLTYQIDSDLWDTSITNGGAVHSATNRLATLSANAGGTNSAILQSHYFAPYTPGRSQLAFVTFTLGSTPGVGAQRRVGMFDGNNGIALIQTSSGVSLALYSYTSKGDEVVSQSSWNVDQMNGTGPSKITIDFSKTQILVISLQALYVGRAYVGFDIDGKIYPVHEFMHANEDAFPYIQYASLPVRYEVSTTSAAVSMDAICASIISEGGDSLENISGRTFTSSNGISSIGVTTRRPVLSIRAKQQLNSINNVGLIIPQVVEVLASTNNAYVEIVLKGSLTGASFTSVDSSSLAEFDTSASAISGGRVVLAFNVPAAAQIRTSSDKGLLGRLLLSYSHLLSSSDVLSVVVTSHTGTTNVSSVIDWKEIR